MAKRLTKSQKKRLAQDILGKAQKLYIAGRLMTMKDYEAIYQIVKRIEGRIEKGM